ncbi:MAG TPA: glycoside hydrolase family 9 protein, partial [Iamia sp.]|nr:glycoside hydrolase family 9 protein [Iamia sp.]
VPTYDGEILVGDGLEPTGGPVDVSGGWFDAGDFLKITGTTAYATVALLLAERAAPATPGLAAEAELGLAWLDRMWDDETGVLYSQVGIGQGNDDVLTDHDVWRLPEDDDESDTEPGDAEHLVGHRPVFPANDPGEPISPNLAGRVSAAFALAAQRTAADDPDAAARWLDRAVAVYEAADADPGALVTAVPNDFYPEDSWADDLELAAAELAVAGEALDDDRAAGWVVEAVDGGVGVAPRPGAEPDLTGEGRGAALVEHSEANPLEVVGAHGVGDLLLADRVAALVDTDEHEHVRGLRLRLRVGARTHDEADDDQRGEEPHPLSLPGPPGRRRRRRVRRRRGPRCCGRCDRRGSRPRGA